MSAAVNRASEAVNAGVRGLIVLGLLTVLAATMFVPTQEGSSEVQAGLLALLGFSVRDYFAARSAEQAAKVDAAPDGP